MAVDDETQPHCCLVDKQAAQVRLPAVKQQLVSSGRTYITTGSTEAVRRPCALGGKPTAALLTALTEMDERCRQYLELEAALKAQQQQP